MEDTAGRSAEAEVDDKYQVALAEASRTISVQRTEMEERQAYAERQQAHTRRQIQGQQTLMEMAKRILQIIMVVHLIWEYLSGHLIHLV